MVCFPLRQSHVADASPRVLAVLPSSSPAGDKTVLTEHSLTVLSELPLRQSRVADASPRVLAVLPTSPPADDKTVLTEHSLTVLSELTPRQSRVADVSPRVLAVLPSSSPLRGRSWIGYRAASSFRAVDCSTSCTSILVRHVPRAPVRTLASSQGSPGSFARDPEAVIRAQE